MESNPKIIPVSSIIPEHFISDIRRLLTSLISIDINDSFVEIETRFGSFTPNLFGFTSGVSRRTFNRTKEAMNNITHFAYTHTIDEIFQEFSDRNLTERFTSVISRDGTPGQTFRLLKTRVQNFDVLDYGFRISISKEVIDDTLKPEGRPIRVREKKRWSYVIMSGKFQLDMTEVTTYQPGQNDAKTVFEIEIEMMGNKLENLNKFEETVVYLLRQIQGTILIYTDKEKEAIIMKTNVLIQAIRKTPLTVDAKSLIRPRNLKVKDMAIGSLIPSSDMGVRYSATIKADGLYRLLVIDELGMFLIHSDQVMKIATSQQVAKIRSWHGTVFETEYIPKSSILPDAPPNYLAAKIYDLIFDTIVLPETQNQSETAVWLQDHPIRLSYAVKFVDKFKNSTTFIFEPKVFLPFNTVPEFYSVINQIMDTTYPFKTDPGIMFTPVNYQYDRSVSSMRLKDRVLKTRPDVLKWKAPEELTIDFAIKHVLSVDGNYITLEVSEGRNIVPFKGQPFKPQTDIEIVPQLQNSPDGTVCEFRYIRSSSEERGKFIFVRFRDDKSHPNPQDVALDVWEDIHFPIDELAIRGQKFSLSFRYHGRVKWDLFNAVGKALKQSPVKVLLDIGSGKGGDIDKWIANGFTHVFCVEPNKKNREELLRRIKPHENIIKCHTIPTVGQDYLEIIKQITKESPTGFVDAISCMLSLSFFFDNPESTNAIGHLVNNLLVKGGYFLALSIDGRYVIEYFSNPANFLIVNGIYQSNMKAIDFQLHPPNTIYIDIPNSIVIRQTEYLTNLPGLQNLLATQLPNPLVLTEEWRTDKEKFLISEEIEYVKLFTAFIMKRT
jgi:hypothetical protein